MARAKGTKLIAENRKARHEYFIEETYECGISLVGTEVKSIRGGKVNLKDSYAQIINELDELCEEYKYLGSYLEIV